MDELTRAQEHGWVWRTETSESGLVAVTQPGDRVTELDGDEEWTYQKVTRGGVPVLYARTRRDTGETELLAPN